MNDMIITGNIVALIKEMKNMLARRLDMKDLGVVDVVLSVKITKISNRYMLFQSHYIEKILDKFDKRNNDIARASVDVSLHLSKNRCDSIS